MASPHVRPRRRGLAGTRLRGLLEERADGPERAHLGTFAEQLVARVQGRLLDLPDEEAAGLVRSAWRFFAAPGPLPRLRALVPTWATEGWDAPVGVIEACLEDRPFIVDSVREELRARGVAVRAFLHPIFDVYRDAIGRIESLGAPTVSGRRESFLHIAVARPVEPAALAALGEAVRARLDDVTLVTTDFPVMLARAQATADELEARGRQRGVTLGADALAAAELLRWLVDGGFVFLGYREHAVEEGSVRVRPGTGLGLLRREERSGLAEGVARDALPAAVRSRLAGTGVVFISKTTTPSPVHRRRPMDDLVVEELDAEGCVVGERRFLGLFTSKATAEEAAEVPLLRRMLRQVLALERAVPGTHDWKEIVAVFNALPKAELFAAGVDDVRADIRTILAAPGEEPVVAVRERPEVRRVSILLVGTGDRLAADARTRAVAAARAQLPGAVLVGEHVAVGEGDRMWVSLAFTGAAPLGEPGVAALRQALTAALADLATRVEVALAARVGDTRAAALAARGVSALPEDYRVATPPAEIARDVERLDGLAATGALAVRVEADPGGTVSLRLYVPGGPLVLADLLPVLGHLGVRALGEDRTVVRPAEGPSCVVHRLQVEGPVGVPLADAAVAGRLETALRAVLERRAPSDPLGRLVVVAGLDWRAVDALRAYAAHAAQAGVGSQAETQAALVEHPEVAAAVFAFFAARLGGQGDPAARREAACASLDGVASVRHDGILRAIVATVAHTTRTTFFTRPPDCDRLALKLASGALAHLPAPRPWAEIWVQSPQVEGVHVRAGRLARGGLRLSDRPADFRTEALGLMRTQVLKNALIVPTGAKGAFVPRAGVPAVEAYRAFVRGLLDVTDDVEDGRIVHPRDMLVLDGEDPYLVVAADKGTAAFSDVANAISAERGFWLGDAFASGGSRGYDHKALGITARGAWESVRTHCWEMGVDADTAPLTVVGIGDMSGDVFGNGLLRSPHLRLRAVFDHRHVLVDPDPDPGRSRAERERLFRAHAGWDAYDRGVLSEGFAFAPRSAKRVPLAPAARRVLGLEADHATGETIVRAILSAEADLLWNGGIGTYVAAPYETPAEVGDPANDGVRIDATALRVRIVAEGGNLGLTQRARVAYALAGGRVNVDAIDNSAGVDLSDHEVNLKLALAPLVAAGRLAPGDRDAVLADATEAVVQAVLAHNRSQSRLLTIDQRRSRSRLAEFQAHVAELEETAGLVRAQQALPEAAALVARQATVRGLVRPELAVLLAYTKLALTDAIEQSPLPDDPIAAAYLAGYFPAALRERFGEALAAHPLRRDIVATAITNTLVDALGMTFLHRLARETGRPLVEAVRATLVAWRLVGGPAIEAVLAQTDPPLDDVLTCRLALEAAVEPVAAWVLAETDPRRPAADVLAECDAAVAPLRGQLGRWLVAGEAEAFGHRTTELELAGLDPETANRLAVGAWLPALLDVTAAARVADEPVPVVAERYFGVAAVVDVAWLDERLGALAARDMWDRRAATALRTTLWRARRALAAGPAPPVARVEPAARLVRELQATPSVGVPALVVVVHTLAAIAGTKGGV